MEILWINLNYIKLLTILQFITIRNSSNGSNIKPQATKRLVKQILFLIFLYSSFSSDLKFISHIILYSALEYTNDNTLRPLAQKGCAPMFYNI